jgi:hypothetical protein
MVLLGGKAAAETFDVVVEFLDSALGAAMRAAGACGERTPVAGGQRPQSRVGRQVAAELLVVVDEVPLGTVLEDELPVFRHPPQQVMPCWPRAPLMARISWCWVDVRPSARAAVSEKCRKARNDRRNAARA